MAKRKDSRFDDLEPQKSSAAQFLTYIAANGVTNEKFEIRYEGETIWMSQKMLAAVYGVEVPNVAYHLRKIFEDAELDKGSVIKEILITGSDGKKYSVKHYNLKVIIALGFKINHERAVQFRKWANEVVEKFTIQGWALAKAHAEAEFAKYRVVQDRLFMSDYDRYLLALEEEAKRAKGEADEDGAT